MDDFCGSMFFSFGMLPTLYSLLACSSALSSMFFFRRRRLCFFFSAICSECPPPLSTGPVNTENILRRAGSRPSSLPPIHTLFLISFLPFLFWNALSVTLSVGFDKGPGRYPVRALFSSDPFCHVERWQRLVFSNLLYRFPTLYLRHSF